jgi:hypothetical protein
MAPLPPSWWKNTWTDEPRAFAEGQDALSQDQKPATASLYVLLGEKKESKWTKAL